MRSMFSLEEVGEMLDMKTSDLEKYMGAEQTRKITSEYLENQNS